MKDVRLDLIDVAFVYTSEPCKARGVWRCPVDDELTDIGLGYNDQKIIEAHDLITAVALGQPVQPDVRFAYGVNKVIDAVDLSCRERRWVWVREFDTEVDNANRINN